MPLGPGVRLDRPRAPARGRPELEAWAIAGVGRDVKRIGFLSFGHWSQSPGSQTRTAADALQQSIELAVAAEEVGADGAYFRVHHFAQQLTSPFPLLAAIGPGRAGSRSAPA